MEKVYNSEEEFLKDYNSDDFEKLSMTTDILIFSVSSEEVDNYRKTDKKKMSILLVLLFYITSMELMNIKKVKLMEK